MKNIIFISLILVNFSCNKTPPKVEIKTDYDTIWELVKIEIMRRESFSDTIYVCPAGYKTIGFGHRIKDKNITKIDTNEGKLLLIKDFIHNLKHVKKHFNDTLAIPLTLTAYNIGINKVIKNFKGKPDSIILYKLTKYVYYKDIRKGKYIKSDNLVKARKFEVTLYQVIMQCFSRTAGS